MQTNMLLVVTLFCASTLSSLTVAKSDTSTTTTSTNTNSNITKAAVTTKPGCQSQCGNVTVPYPFGIGSGCFIGDDSSWFKIDCNTSFKPPKLSFGSSCDSFCYKAEDVPKYDCSGAGCCQIKIPKGLQYYNIHSLETYYSHTNVWSFNPCGYAFVGEQDSFKFNGTSDLSDPNFKNKTKANVPIVLDWVIGNQTCAQARQDSNAFACQLNSNCSDSVSGLEGYRCSCLHGYEGNPYLSPGCQVKHERSEGYGKDKGK